MIQCKKISKIYGEVAVLDSVSLDIAQGEFVCLVGVSGAGKTTLIEAIIGNISLDYGEVFVDGKRLDLLSFKELQESRRNFGVIFQEFLLLQSKTVYENIAFALEVCGYSDEEINKRVLSVLEIVKMSANQDKFPHQLSGGEKQRVAIARALAHYPKVIIADEPTGNLDPNQSNEIIDLLRAINSGGITVLLATHDKAIVDELGKRVITMHGGRVVSDWKIGSYFEEVIVLKKDTGIEIVEIFD